MPTDILMTDVRFPSEASLKGKKTDEKIGVITNYLYMLKEQLAYNMYHIGSSQLLPSVTDDITAPLFKHLEDQDGNITELQVTAKGLSASVSDINENIATLQLTADAFATMVRDGEGNQSSLTQLAEAFATRVTDAYGNASLAIQTAEGLVTDVSDAKGNASKALQTAQGFYLSTTNNTDGTEAFISLWNDGKIYGQAQKIALKGYVSFTDLSGSGTTTINGDNITTGTIEAIDIEGCTITGSIIKSILKTNGTSSGELQFYLEGRTGKPEFLGGGIRFDASGGGTSEESTFRVFMYAKDISSDAPVSLKLQSDSAMSIEAGTTIWMRSDTVNIVGRSEDGYLQTDTKEVKINSGGTATIILKGQDIFLLGNIYANGTPIS